MSPNNLATIEQLNVDYNFINIGTFNSEQDYIESGISTNITSYKKINYQPLDLLFSDYHSMPADKIDLLIKSFVLNQINFYEIIRVFLDRPDSTLLDIAKTCLVRYEENEFYIVISYLKNDSINEFVKAYFIETIVIWDSINSLTRETELNNVFNSESNDFLKEIIRDAIRDISG